MVKPSQQEWEAFYTLFTFRKLERNQVYLAQGEISRKLAFVAKGCFRMYYLVDGEERCKDFQIEGQFTGSLYSFMSYRPALFSVAAVEESEVLEITREKLLAVYDQYPVWDRFGRKYLEQLFLYKEAREAALLTQSARERYEDLLKNQPHLLARLPLKYISSYLGVKPESLSRLRKNF